MAESKARRMWLLECCFLDVPPATTAEDELPAAEAVEVAEADTETVEVADALAEVEDLHEPKKYKLETDAAKKVEPEDVDFKALLQDATIHRAEDEAPDEVATAELPAQVEDAPDEAAAAAMAAPAETTFAEEGDPTEEAETTPTNGDDPTEEADPEAENTPAEEGAITKAVIIEAAITEAAFTEAEDPTNDVPAITDDDAEPEEAPAATEVDKEDVDNLAKILDEMYDQQGKNSKPEIFTSKPLDSQHAVHRPRVIPSGSHLVINLLQIHDPNVYNHLVDHDKMNEEMLAVERRKSRSQSPCSDEYLACWSARIVIEALFSTRIETKLKFKTKSSSRA